MKYHLAIDIGASSGRHILGYLDNGRLKLEEIYRFENNMTDAGGTLTWDIESLVKEVKAGIAECKKTGRIPETVAIDTWGVDYVLLDENKKEILPAVAYRDSRTFKAVDEVEKVIPAEELYRRTGIQKQFFNTIYQLWCDKKSGKLDKAKYFLLMPDYLSFRLSGETGAEYTIASTTGLVSAASGDWDYELIDKLGFSRELFVSLSMPCTKLGDFSPETAAEVGFNAAVLHCPSHDTASAVTACCAGESGVYVSSGTWSLIGIESESPVITGEAMQCNFTNEGGINRRYRFLKNIMGMWLFQNIRRNLGKKYTYDEMMEMAKNSSEYRYINPNAPEFNAPENMIKAIEEHIGEGELPLETVIASVYHSLAKSYADTVAHIEKISGKKTDCINIMGGGCKDKYLNELTGVYTGKKIITGPVEATATGNILSQMMYSDKELTLDRARALIV